ncbi:hypothetical protein [Embleya sp. AB8]|uniref:hypothetical protein n=1 Tax=Embleya sp. AB8 TaxID=3156304 RepID=UPI003C77E790
MELTRYVENPRFELSVGAEAEGDRARDVVERLVGPPGFAARSRWSAVRSAAVGETTREPATGPVELRSRGVEPGFVVTLTGEPGGEGARAVAGSMPMPMPGSGSAPAPAPAVDVPADDGYPSGSSVTSEDPYAPARIDFRPPVRLRARRIRAADQERHSVDARLVRALPGAPAPVERGRVGTEFGAESGPESGAESGAEVRPVSGRTS